MMKKRLVIYLEADSEKKLRLKAQDSGFVGRAALSNYIEKIAQEPICFLDGNVKALLETLKFKNKK